MTAPNPTVKVIQDHNEGGTYHGLNSRLTNCLRAKHGMSVHPRDRGALTESGSSPKRPERALKNQTKTKPNQTKPNQTKMA